MPNFVGDRVDERAAAKWIQFEGLVHVGGKCDCPILEQVRAGQARGSDPINLEQGAVEAAPGAMHGFRRNSLIEAICSKLQ
jgi:hypothetical protein